MVEEQSQPQEETPSDAGAMHRDAIRESWWNLPILNSSVAAYQCGRLLNQFRWHAEQEWLLRDRTHFQHSMAILAELAAVPCEVAGCNAPEITARIRELENDWRDTRFCERAWEAIEHLAYPHLFPDSFREDFSIEREYSAKLYAWVKPIVDRLCRIFAEEFPQAISGCLELGRCIDEGVRPGDVCRFMYRPPRRPEGSGANDEEVDSAPDGPPATAGMDDDEEEFSLQAPRDFRPDFLPEYSPRPGELSPERSWTGRLLILCKKVGIGLARSDLASLDVADSGEPLQHLVAEIDQRIRQGLGQLPGSEDAPLVLAHLGLSFDAGCNLRRKGFDRRVQVTAPLSKELLRMLMRAGEGYCQREELHRAWVNTGKPTPKSSGRLDTERSRLNKQLCNLQVSVQLTLDGYHLVDLQPPVRDSITTPDSA
jgi:hypothetical protein